MIDPRPDFERILFAVNPYATKPLGAAKDYELCEFKKLESQWHKKFKVLHKTTPGDWVLFETVHVRYKAIRRTEYVNDAYYTSPKIILTNKILESITVEEYLFRNIIEMRNT